MGSVDLAALIAPTVSALCAAIVAVFTYLLRSYFGRIHDDLRSVAASVDKLSGRLESLQADVRANTVQDALTQSELKAIWRYVDHARERASDATNGG